MDQKHEQPSHATGDPSPPVVRFFESDRELTELEFLAKHPEQWVRDGLADLRIRFTSIPCTCHGKQRELHVDGVSDGRIELQIDWCEEEFERNAKARKAASVIPPEIETGRWMV